VTEPLTPRTAPVIDDWKPDATLDTRQCAKCGADDIAVRWDGDHYDCLYKQVRRSDWPREGGEHLHHQCRTCGWSWATALATREEMP